MLAARITSPIQLASRARRRDTSKGERRAPTSVLFLMIYLHKKKKGAKSRPGGTSLRGAGHPL